MKIKNKILSLILVFSIVFASIPCFVYAEDLQTNESAQSENTGENTDGNTDENTAEDKSDGELNLDTFENSLIDRTLKMLEQTYKYDVEAKDVYRNALRVILAKHPEYLDDALKGIFSNLDPHSEYYTAEEYNKFIESINNEYYGIGVIVTAVDGGLKVVRVIKNSPASGAGIKKDDLIVCVGGVNIVGMGINEAKSHIIGEQGSEVSVDLIRDGENMTFSMKRDLVNDESGFYDVIDGKIGYILLYSFEGHSSDFISEALSYFDTLGITKVIFDLRSNPGGSLAELVKIGNMLFPKGPIISFEYKDPKKNFSFDSDLENPKYDIIALINGNSASASEAFAGAVQDTNVGIAIGEQSYGKGTKQLVSRIVSGGGVRLTDSEYLTAGGRHINGVGITPDIYLKNRIVKYDRKYYAPLVHDRILSQGDTGEDVLCFKQRLDALGFFVEIPNDEFDENMYYAVKDFQQMTGLYPYGVLDFTTQLKIEEVLKQCEVEIDDQLAKAVEVFNYGSTAEYMKKYKEEN